jgi:hypothetical protein
VKTHGSKSDGLTAAVQLAFSAVFERRDQEVRAAPPNLVSSIPLNFGDLPATGQPPGTRRQRLHLY